MLWGVGGVRPGKVWLAINALLVKRTGWLVQMKGNISCRARKGEHALGGQIRLAINLGVRIWQFSPFDELLIGKLGSASSDSATSHNIYPFSLSTFLICISK